MWKCVNIKNHHNFNQRRVNIILMLHLKTVEKKLFARYMRSCKGGVNFVTVNVNIVSPSGDSSHRVWYQGLKTISKVGCYISRHSSAVVESVNFVLFRISSMIYLTWHYRLRCIILLQLIRLLLHVYVCTYRPHIVDTHALLQNRYGPICNCQPDPNVLI